jgi:alkylation response protein AidB-like acyl-CoA dehydrogenase
VLGAHASAEDDLTMRLAGSHSARACTEAVQIAFMAGGTAGIYEASPIQRFHRDVMVAQQHGMVAYYSFENLGREWLSRRSDQPPA